MAAKEIDENYVGNTMNPVSELPELYMNPVDDYIEANFLSRGYTVLEKLGLEEIESRKIKDYDEKNMNYLERTKDAVDQAINLPGDALNINNLLWRTGLTKQEYIDALIELGGTV